MAGLDESTFEGIHPARFLSFTIPSPSPSFTPPTLRVAVLDSPIQPDTADSPPVVAAMFVPKHRESDWIFSTEAGQLQLLLGSPNIQRLILIGEHPVGGRFSTTIYRRPLETDSQKRLEESLIPLVTALAPKSCFINGSFNVPILSYEDNVVCSVVLEKCVGPVVGEMLVEDVEIESGGEGKREFRRRLRFKRLPNLVQTEIRIVPKTGFDSEKTEIGGNVEFQPDFLALVHVYLVPMVASLALIASRIEERIEAGFRPKALCVGVGGGALLGFLRSQLGFHVVGVEMDEEVLRIARRYFGLEVGDCIQLFVGDAIEFMKELANQANNHKEMNDCCLETNNDDADPKFDVIMVDLDSSDMCSGVSAPPLEFVRKSVLLAAKSVLGESGIFVINVIPPSRLFYEKLIHQFKEVFHELYEIDSGNGENFVLIAKVLPTMSSIGDVENSFLKKLRLVVSGAYMDSIRKI
ncbi:hypothetical protein SLA2020_470630 [Shorea laevis]